MAKSMAKPYIMIKVIQKMVKILNLDFTKIWPWKSVTNQVCYKLKNVKIPE